MISKRALVALAAVLHSVAANVEKTIFLGPEPITIPTQKPTIVDLQLDTLTPEGDWSLRTHIPAQFPTDTKPRGEAYWIVLEGLTPGRRYEVRVCWAATQPTSFDLTTFPLQTVFDTPELITSLSEFSYGRLAASNAEPPSAVRDVTAERQGSLLLLRVLAAADYFSTNKTLMENVPPVYADIILDPYLLNVLPRSLVPTVCVLLLVAVAAWILVSQVILPWLSAVVAEGLQGRDARKQEMEKKMQ